MCTLFFESFSFTKQCSYLLGAIIAFSFISNMEAMQARAIQACRTLYRGAKVAAVSLTRPGHVPVFMNEIGKIQLSRESKKLVKISTTGLCGCIATVLHLRHVDQTQQALLSHFARSEDEKHKAILMEALKNLQGNEIAKATFLVAGPSSYLGANAAQKDPKKMFVILEKIVHEQMKNRVVSADYVTYENHPFPGKGLAEIEVMLSNQAASYFKLSSVFNSRLITFDK